MSDLSKKPKAHYAPVYAAACYPGFAEIARKHGYALAVHGSLARDFDIIAIPWIEAPSDPEIVVKELVETYSLWQTHDKKEMLHGRLCWTLTIGFGECFCDLSFMPAAFYAPTIEMRD